MASRWQQAWQRLGRWRWPIAAGAAFAVGWAVLGPAEEAGASTGPGSSPASSLVTAPGRSAPTVAAAATAPSQFGAAARESRAQQLALWRARYDQAEQVYNSYREATRYPPESRPLAEHPDQVRPFEPVAEDKPMRDAQGKPVRGVKLRTTQERVFLSGNETVRFTVEALDENGRPLPLIVDKAAARSIPDGTALIQITETALAFTDDGQGGDLAPGDGRHSALLAPRTQGFASFAGTIRVLAQVQARGQPGVAHYEVVYQPLVPATWAGGVREAVEQGSLQWYVKADVQVAGRYVVSGRVFDADDRPVALAQFNDEVAAGSVEFRLTVFGALLRDRAPRFPLKLVDVDGFLLQPDTYPDRAMMARRAGLVHTSGSYALDRFSGEEWQGEERQRHLAEYQKDLREAEQALQRLGR